MMARLRVIVMMLGVLMVMLFAALRRVLELQSPASAINPYDGVGIAGENSARLEGGSNIGGCDTHESKNNDATKSSKLHERVS